MKFLKVFIGIALFMFIFSVPSFAKEQAQNAEKVEKTLVPICEWKKVHVTPGNDLSLKGSGMLKAKGKGDFHFKIRQGRVRLEGKGVVGIKVSNNDKVDVSGIGKKVKIGDWVIYFGKGSLTVRGDDYEIVGYGRFKMNARGTGAVTFHGNWLVEYCRLRKLSAQPIPSVISNNLKLEAEKISE